jgi:hypothetical protein
VADLLVEDTTWAIRYLRIAAKYEYAEGTLYVSPSWIRDFRWLDKTITLDLKPEELRRAPTVGKTGTLVRIEETQIHEHFRRPRYWV